MMEAFNRTSPASACLPGDVGDKDVRENRRLVLFSRALGLVIQVHGQGEAAPETRVAGDSHSGVVVGENGVVSVSDRGGTGK
jgi:hypothetical protein